MDAALLARLSRLPAFPETAKELVFVAGITAAARLISAWGGQHWPVPKMSERTREDGEMRFMDLAGLTGMAAANAIVRHYGGCELYIPKCERALKQYFQSRLVEEYDAMTRQGVSHRKAIFDLGVRYNKTGRQIEQRLNLPVVLPDDDAQAKLF
ncbi:MAG: hypothetical protein LBO00_07550 [Zoogloeaceae bacterium]|jgi:hypothetical protein|nr:hypothetical protein [Zoogloeaceae bacterium]